ncbi:dipeptidase PepE [Alteromonas lipolytica]|uniref:Dipeptidase E n=1 Tax=Alteromonas lipolytica TaxID=1856405 RepID=A0A1E8FEK4_9ALTE|nr:dipeptidase PepE [Alteromonas lipolytica]OFI34377.1 dipeptidase E [Alteromonas lipolytica]GGF81975.1 peptidase E [Alteromonas lipolytica]
MPTESNHHVLMLSSSRMGDEDYLEHAREMIFTHLDTEQTVLFIPYAGVTLNWDDYLDKVQQALPELTLTSIHQCDDPVAAVKEAKAIMVGGGNTFNLLYQLYQQQIIEPLQQLVSKGTPYIGWSAGSNICGNSIRTTNDMPIIEPPSFTALNFLSCQLNPHYTDYQPPNHNGETRDDRLFEFTRLNPDTPVLAIREGTALQYTAGRLTLLGELEGFCFEGDEKTPIAPGQDLTRYI